MIMRIIVSLVDLLNNLKRGKKNLLVRLFYLGSNSMLAPNICIS